MLPLDLFLVLHALKKPPFKPECDIGLGNFSYKVSFLVAVMPVADVRVGVSCKVLFLVVHNDKGVFFTQGHPFLSVVLVFYINENIVLPYLCPAPKHQKEISLHCLDAVSH